MRLPNISPWLAGRTVTAADFNEIRYALWFIANPPRVLVSRATAQTLSAWTDIAFDTVHVDSEAAAGETPMWSSGDPTKVYIRTPGWYEAVYSCAFAGYTTANDNKISLDVNDASKHGRHGHANGLSGTSTPHKRVRNSWPLFLVPGDFVQLSVASCRTTSTLAESDLANKTSLSLRWMSR